VSPATEHPTEAWVLQQSRNVPMWVDDPRIDLRFLIHDRDTKFSEASDEMFTREGGGVVLTPCLAPIANCYAESWIGSMKRECLNHFSCFSLGHPDHIVAAYVSCYNTVRPHQEPGNVLIPERGKERATYKSTEPLGKVGCQEWLGGVLKHYYRKAA
jgi:putative transposase